MPNRITGMYSGMDTETLIKDLVKAKSKKVETLNKGKTKLEWKQEKWNDLNTKVKNFFSKSVANLRWATSFTKKATSVSDTNAVSVITGDKAMNSVQKLSIKQLASSGYLTGSKISVSDGTKATGETLVSSLSFGTQTFAAGSFNVTTGGKTTQINVDASTTIDSVVSQLNAAGVTANFDEKQQRLFIGATDSGSDFDFTITAGNAGGNTAMSLLGINATPSEAVTKEYEKMASYSSYFTGATAADWVDAIQADVDSDIYKRLNTLAEKNFNKEIEQKQAAINELKAAEEPDEDAIKAAEEELEAFKAAGVSTTAMEAAATSLKEQVDFAASAGSIDASNYNTDAVKLVGKNAIIELNDVAFESNTNNVEVNGITYTCKALAENITVTTQDDTDGIYDMIKGFIKEFNSIINEIDSLYNADSTKLEPLTDEERDAVSDTEADKLEKKVKDALLRRDDDLGSLFNGLRDAMNGSITVGDKELNLSYFGINTLSYFTAKEGERYAFHIDGDSDDGSTGGNADKLKGLIATDSQTVVDFFTQLGKNLYTKMSDISAGSDYRTYGSFFDDKSMKTDISDYEKKIAEAEAKLQREEDKLYDKFSRMEVALSKMSSSTNYLSSLFTS